MGKRYGRNKKRKHQEKIESLEALNEAHLRAIDMIDRDRSRALHALKELHEALNRANPYSSFLPPRVLSLHPDTLRHGPLELSEHKPVPVNFDPSADYAALDAPDVRRIPFYEVTAEIALNPERYQARCHLLLRESLLLCFEVTLVAGRVRLIRNHAGIECLAVFLVDPVGLVRSELLDAQRCQDNEHGN